MHVAAADGDSAWIKTERGQGDAGNGKQKPHNRPSRDSGMSGQGPRDSELGQGDSVLGHGDGAPARFDEAVIQTLIAPIKQQFTEELAQRDARIQNLERKVEMLAVADRGNHLTPVLTTTLQQLWNRYWTMFPSSMCNALTQIALRKSS